MKNKLVVRFRILLNTILLMCLGGICFAQNGDWHGTVGTSGVNIVVVFHIGDDSSTMDVPVQQVSGLPVEATFTQPATVNYNIPAIPASFEGLFMGNQIVGTFKQGPYSFPLTLYPGLPEIVRPQTPRPPFPYTTEEVVFVNGDASLSGTLTLPKNCSSDTPVIVFVTGSGLQDRDETLFDHKPFAVIADTLARAGIASLRYDDRGFGESTGDVASATTEDFKNDALAGMEAMRSRFGKVGVLGHSEGGTIALMIAEEGKADFVISVAGNIVSGRQTLVWQNGVALRAAGYDDAVVEEYCRAIGDIFDACAASSVLPDYSQYNLPDALAGHRGLQIP